MECMYITIYFSGYKNINYGTIFKNGNGAMPFPHVFLSSINYVTPKLRFFVGRAPGMVEQVEGRLRLVRRVLPVPRQHRLCRTGPFR